MHDRRPGHAGIRGSENAPGTAMRAGELEVRVGWMEDEVGGESAEAVGPRVSAVRGTQDSLVRGGKQDVRVGRQKMDAEEGVRGRGERDLCPRSAAVHRLEHAAAARAQVVARPDDDATGIRRIHGKSPHGRVGQIVSKARPMADAIHRPGDPKAAVASSGVDEMRSCAVSSQMNARDAAVLRAHVADRTEACPWAPDDARRFLGTPRPLAGGAKRPLILVRRRPPVPEAPGPVGVLFPVRIELALDDRRLLFGGLRCWSRSKHCKQQQGGEHVDLLRP